MRNGSDSEQPPKSIAMHDAVTESDTDDGSTSVQAGVQSVEIAALILKALAGGGVPMPLKGVAKAAHMSRAKVHRYLVSLKRTGLVAQEVRSGEYRIGPAAVSLGLVGLRAMSPVRAVTDSLPGLRDMIQETVTMAIWGEAGPVVISMEEPSKPVTINVRIGSILPIATSVIGRAFATFLPEAMTRDAMLRERALALENAMPLPDHEEMATILAEVRTRGMARVRGSIMPGIDALAAPVFDHTGKVVAVVCTFGRAGAFDSRWTGRNVQVLDEVTSELSRQFGFAEAALARPEAAG